MKFGKLLLTVVMTLPWAVHSFMTPKTFNHFPCNSLGEVSDYGLKIRSNSRLCFSFEETQELLLGSGGTVDWNSLWNGKDEILDSIMTSPIVQSLVKFSLGREDWILAVAGIALLGVSWNVLSNPKEDYRSGFEPYPRGEYDPIAARAYYRNHPGLVLVRFCELLRLYNSFLLHVALDKYVFQTEEKNRAKRANELLEVIQRAGPTSIKVGQALSVRPDLIAPEYAQALGSLQDRVPPFDSQKGFELMESEWSKKVNTKAANADKINIPNKNPVASASIGQVYKGTIHNGELDVAIKVQRPNVLAEIALDLYLVKEYLAPMYKFVTRSATDLSSLANEWGRGFIYELDYNTEAMNTLKFNQDMKDRNLDNVVIAPNVITDFSTERILVTEWVDGVRLDESKAADVPRLCGVALNAYLVMLLETGTLHCDPHPGNLLCTKDGKLVILDFGMTLETDPKLQYSLLEFVAHLTSGDYDKIPQDFVEIGFLKKERLDTVLASGFLEPLTYMFKQAKQGGGGTKVRQRIIDEYKEKYPGLEDEELRVAMRADMKEQMEVARKEASAVSGITMEVEELQRRNRDAFSIPEWFLYTSRAFLTLEGISLQADEDYSIIQSCFPYVAKRLLNDDSPRVQKALKDLLYGAGNSLDSETITDLADGFSTFSSTTSTTKSTVVKQTDKDSSNQSLAQTEATVTLAKESADILLSPKGNMVQSLLIQESTLATSAQVKDTLRTISSNAPIFGNLLASGMAPFLRKTKEEEQAQKLLDSLLSNVVGSNNDDQSKREEISIATLTNGGLNELTPEQIALLAKEVRENLPKYGPLLGQLGGKFATALLDRASLNIEDTLANTKESDNISDSVVRTAAKGLSTVASQGAEVIRNTNNSENSQSRLDSANIK